MKPINFRFCAALSLFAITTFAQANPTCTGMFVGTQTINGKTQAVVAKDYGAFSNIPANSSAAFFSSELIPDGIERKQNTVPSFVKANQGDLYSFSFLTTASSGNFDHVKPRLILNEGNDQTPIKEIELTAFPYSMGISAQSTKIDLLISKNPLSRIDFLIWSCSPGGKN